MARPWQFNPGSSSTAPGGLGDLPLWGGGKAGPIQGGNFREWAERLRDVETVLDDSKLRELAAQVQDAAWDIRLDLKRKSNPPTWPVVQERVAEPLYELRDRLVEELARISGKDELAPLDRDLVPTRYADLVRRYYEELGSEKRAAE